MPDNNSPKTDRQAVRAQRATEDNDWRKNLPLDLELIHEDRERRKDEIAAGLKAIQDGKGVPFAKAIEHQRKLNAVTSAAILCVVSGVPLKDLAGADQGMDRLLADVVKGGK